MNAESSQAEAASGDRNPSAGTPLSLTFRNDAASLASARERVRQHLHADGVDDAANYAIDLSLEELAGNTLRYGYDTEEERAIRVDVTVTRTAVRIAITDDARPFDPTLHPDPQLPRTLGEAPAGGRGISMVRRVVHAMRYRREAGRNRLEVDVQRVTRPH